MSDEFDMDEVWGMYAEEGGRSLDDVEESLLILQDEPSNTDAVGRLFRALHTFKGNARVLGLSVVESIAHLGEDMIGLVRDEGHVLDSDICSLLMEATDMLRGMLENTASIRRDVDRSVAAELSVRMKAKCDACRAEKANVGAAPQEENQPTQSIIFEPVESDSLGNDPVYRDIFFGMVREVLQEMCEVLKSDLLIEECQAKFAAEEERLHHAAEQMGMREWQQILKGSIGIVHAAKDQMELQEMRLRVLYEQELSGQKNEGNSEVAGESAPIPVDEANEKPNSEGTQSLIFGPVDTDSLGNDPIYREMFFGMVHDVLKEMRAVLKSDIALSQCQATFAEERERLLHAAEQMGMRDWQQALLDLRTFVNPSLEQLTQQESRLRVLYENELGVIMSNAEKLDSVQSTTVNNDPVYSFFNELKHPLGKLSQLGNHLFENDGVSITDIVKLAGEISALAENHGFVRVADVLNKVVSDAHTGREPLANHFTRLEFLLYQELVSIVHSLDLNGAELAFNPEAILRSWCVDHVFETLLEMRNALERIKSKTEVQLQCDRIVDYMHQVYYACLFYELETAAHLSMSILDLFARAKAGEMTPDTVLLHIAKSFINDIELILDSAGSGETPDMAKIEKLLMDASEASFTSSGTVSSSQIEARLGLPKSFHKVLTAENIQAVMYGFENNHHFCIIRAELNDDEELAGRFMNWMGSGAAQVISNVTVFVGDHALFDFLISSPLNEVDMSEALTVLDPKGKCLHVEMTLIDRKAVGQGTVKVGDQVVNESVSVAHTHEDDASHALSMQGAISGDMLESIGELVTGQAMMKHSLASLFEADLIRLVETDVVNAGGNWQAARGTVRQTLEKWLENVEKLMQLESHNSALIDRLQEEAIAERMRPAGLLLKPLGPFIDVQARHYSRQVSLVVVGDEVQLDFSMLESLKTTLRALVTFCVIHSIESSEFRIAAGKPGKGQIRVVLVKHDDHIALTVDDDGCGINMERVEQRARQLGWNNEKLDVSLALRDGFGKVANSEAEGVELSIIRNQLRNLGGDLRVNNQPNGGTHFSLTMPLSMVVLEGMVVRVGEVQYVVPIDAIQRIVRAGASELMRVSAEHGNYKLHMEGDDVLPIQFLRRNGEAASNEGIRLSAMEEVLDGEDDAIKNLFVLVGKNNHRMALSVDELIGQQQVLIRPLLGHLSGIRGVTGCALLGSGDVGMVLDMGYVLKQGTEVSE